MTTTQWIRSVTEQEKPFYQALGQRLASLRKAQGITQQQLADQLGISQKTIAHYEVGRLRVAASMLPNLALILKVTVAELIGTEDKARNRRGPASKLQQQIEQIQQLPRAKQRFVTEMLDTVIQQAS